MKKRESIKVLCVEDLVMQNITVFHKGCEYTMTPAEGEKSIWEMRSDNAMGVGLFSEDDPTFKRHFKREGTLFYNRKKKQLQKRPKKQQA